MNTVKLVSLHDAEHHGGTKEDVFVSYGEYNENREWTRVSWRGIISNSDLFNLLVNHGYLKKVEQ